MLWIDNCVRYAARPMKNLNFSSASEHMMRLLKPRATQCAYSSHLIYNTLLVSYQVAFLLEIPAAVPSRASRTAEIHVSTFINRVSMYLIWAVMKQLNSVNPLKKMIIHSRRYSIAHDFITTFHYLLPPNCADSHSRIINMASGSDDCLRRFMGEADRRA